MPNALAQCDLLREGIQFLIYFHIEHSYCFQTFAIVSWHDCNERLFLSENLQFKFFQGNFSSLFLIFLNGRNGIADVTQLRVKEYWHYFWLSESTFLFNEFVKSYCALSCRWSAIFWIDIPIFINTFPPLGGFEPPTFRLTAERASQLRHRGLLMNKIRIKHFDRNKTSDSIINIERRITVIAYILSQPSLSSQLLR